MSFDFNSLITDRSQADVDALSELLVKPISTWTPEELDRFNGGLFKGGYWWTDLNRVTACMEYLNEEFKRMGYWTGYSQVVVHEDKSDKNTLLLLHGEEISDNSLYKHPIENYGVQVSEGQSKFGGKSLHFPGNGLLRVTDKSFIFGTSDFTFDWWEYKKAALGTVISVNILSDIGYSNLLLHQGNTLYSATVPTAWDSISNAVIRQEKLNQWSHTAIVRKGTELLVFQDGKKTWSKSSFTANFNSGGGILQIGAHAISPVSDYFTGYIDEFRVSKVARWTENFTPPITPYENPQEQPLDKYIWHEFDSPKESQLVKYLNNVKELRKVLSVLEGTPNAPSSYRKWGVETANAIEKILLSVENRITRVLSSVNLGWALGTSDIGLYGGL